MTTRNPEYDFKWCPGCGDFGVRRALESALTRQITETEELAENTVVVAGIGCSGNMVHLLEKEHPYGIHGIHGRTMPLSMGIKMSSPELNVVVVAGDGDFLGIGMEHIAPQAARNLDVTAVVMDNGVYGLTKGQSSPTTDIGQITSSTPFGKIEEPINPLRMYLSMGVSFVASAMSSKVKDMSNLIYQAMNHPGFAIVHIQSPCTEYNNTYEVLKGNQKKGIAPLAWDIPQEYDPTDIKSAYEIVNSDGIPLGLVFSDDTRSTFHEKVAEMSRKTGRKSVESLLSSYAV